MSSAVQHSFRVIVVLMAALIVYSSLHADTVQCSIRTIHQVNKLEHYQAQYKKSCS